MKKITEYRRNLPHINPENAVFFITYRIAGSLPKHLINELSEKKKMESNLKYFEKFDHFLDQQEGQLNQKEVAQIIAESLLYYHKKHFSLLAYCIMPNHVHLLINTNNYPHKDLFSLLKVIKGISANKINKLLNKSGQFWHHESFDRVVRDRNELSNVISYIKNNPVKAELVPDWKDWHYTYIDKKYRDED